MLHQRKPRTTKLITTLKILSAFCVFFAISSPSFAHEFKVGNLEIVHPWSRETPVTAKVAGGYLILNNKGESDDRLVSITSDISDNIQIHSMEMVDNIMKMRHMPDGVELKAGQEVIFRPGGYHIMFMNVKKHYKAGENFKATLNFEKAGAVDVTFNVEEVGQNHDTHN